LENEIKKKCYRKRRQSEGKSYRGDPKTGPCDKPGETTKANQNNQSKKRKRDDNSKSESSGTEGSDQ